jgi:pyruvate formate lyase activating enzyme
MIIKGYLPTSAIEWSGKVSAVIFTGGCNFRCSFCHNPQLVLDKEQGLEDKSDESILEDLEKRKKWLDAVVVSGGEPTLQPDLIDFLKKVKALGLKVMIETNGSRPNAIAKLLKDQIVDYFSIDIKGPLDKTYKQIIKLPDLPADATHQALQAGFQIANLRETLDIVVKSKIPFELRTTIVPGIHDEKNIKKIAQQIKQLTINHQPLTIEWFLQTFSPKKCLDPEFEKIKPYTQKEMEKMLQIAQKILPNTRLR